MKVCANCFNDPALQLAIESNGETGRCEITGEEAKVIDTIDLSDSFDSFISAFIESKTGIPFYEKIQSDWNLFKDQYGEIIFKSLLEERGSQLTIHTKVDYSEAYFNKRISLYDFIKNG